jgi:hypothetical protein
VQLGIGATGGLRDVDACFASGRSVEREPALRSRFRGPWLRVRGRRWQTSSAPAGTRPLRSPRRCRSRTGRCSWSPYCGARAVAAGSAAARLHGRAQRRARGGADVARTGAGRQRRPRAVGTLRARRRPTRRGGPRVGPSITQNNGPTGSCLRSVSHGRSAPHAHMSTSTSRRCPPLPRCTSTEQRFGSTKVGLGQRERFLDPQRRAPQHHDQRAGT